MTFKRRRSSQGRITILPPSLRPEGHEDLRTQFAQAALSNTSLMIGVKSPEEAAKRALAVADAMMLALRHPPIPSIKIPVPRSIPLHDIDKSIRRDSQTIRPIGRILSPSPDTRGMKAVNPLTMRPGCYRHLRDENDEDESQ